MSSYLILALLFCFEVQDIIYVEGNEYKDLHLDNWKKWISWLFNAPGPLSPVNLTVDSVWNSSDSCNLNVTCSIEDFDISSTFICDTKFCYQEGGEHRETSAGFSVSLHVYLSDGSIICNNSNQVSWTSDTTEIRHFCAQNAGSKSLSDGVSICVVKTVVFSVGLIIMVSAIISVHVIEKLKT